MNEEQTQLRFEDILASHEVMVWTLCLRMTGDRALAQDAHQDCFIRVWLGLAGFRGEAKASSWIWRIAVRCCREVLEREKRLPLAGEVEELDDLPGGGGADPATGVEHRDTEAFLLRMLKPRERALVHLRYTQELSHEEIAQAMEMSASAVRVALHRARETMRNGWERAHAPAKTAGSELALAGGNPG